MANASEGDPRSGRIGLDPEAVLRWRSNRAIWGGVVRYPMGEAGAHRIRIN